MRVANETSDSGSEVSINSHADFDGNLQDVTVPLAIGKQMSVGAYTYSQGNSIQIADVPGKSTIAHEASHIVQQRQGRLG